MQAWVTNNGQNSQSGPRSQPGAHGPSGYDGTASPEKGHVYQSQPAPAQENFPPQRQYQSRGPVVSANRNAVAAIARVPTGRSGTPLTGHIRQTSLKMERNKTASSEPLQASHRHKPFWDESTVDGSLFDETASNADSRTAQQHLMPSFSDRGYKQRDTPRQRSGRRDIDEVGTLPFVIGDNGMIDVVKNPLQKSSSTPDARASSKGAPHDSDSYAEDTSYHAALETSPPKTLNHSRAKIPVRAAQRLSYSDRNSHSSAQNGMSSPPEQKYQPIEIDLEHLQREDMAHLTIPEHAPHRSTMFENIDTPIVSHLDSEDEGVEAPSTPRQKKSPEVKRILFSKGSQGRNSLHESPLPRAPSEKSDKHQSSAKKRQFELDYDDAMLARMSYDDLKSQSFDVDPAQAAEAQPADVPSQGTLPEKLKYFLNKDQVTQAAFFTKMPVAEWDDSGDWFLESFGNIMHRLKEARHAKRQLVDEFENEIAEREEAVRSKIHTIGQTLGDLRKDGEGLMRGKELG